MKILSLFLIVFFLNHVLVVPLRAESLYKNTMQLSQGAIFRNNVSENSFEAELQKIHGRQNAGRTIFFGGCGLGVAYLAGLYFSKTVTFEYFVGMPLMAIAVIWYGYSETIAANNEEAILIYQNQMKGAREAE